MFKPFRLTDDWRSRVESTYRAPYAMNQGALVAIDYTDTTPINSSVGYSSLISGSLTLATITTASGDRELGILVSQVMDGGRPLFPDQILGFDRNYFTVPTGLTAPVYRTIKGDVVGTTEYVGYLPGDAGAGGFINNVAAASFGALCGIYQGRFRLAQTGDTARAKFVGNSTQAGVAVGLFEIL